MKILYQSVFICAVGMLAACKGEQAHPHGLADAQHAEAEPEKGPHRGRLLRDGSFALELAIFETGVPPEFRAWVTHQGKPVNPQEIALNIVLTRLGGVENKIHFAPQGEFLRSDRTIHEPHSFVVSINAGYAGKSHQWRYDNFEGRTRIAAGLAQALKIDTAIAGPAVLKETVQAYGRLIAHPGRTRKIVARFEGLIKQVEAVPGQQVRKGQPLLTIESNESLKAYTLSAPIDGVVRERDANPGEQTDGRTLMVIDDTSTLMAELSVFPSARQRVLPGAAVSMHVVGQPGPTIHAVVSQIDTHIQPNQSARVRAQITNDKRLWIAGAFVNAGIEVLQYSVPLAVQRSGLQSFRNFEVVYAKVGDEYEVRMLQLGRVAGEWVEVLGGLTAGTEYVSMNSYILKADIEKSGASHDH